MQRTLGGFETAAVLTGEAQALNVVIVLQMAEGIAPERLERALAALQRRHPLLGVRVVRQGRGYRFVDGAPAPPLHTVERGDGVAWRAVAEEELNRPLDLAIGPPIRCVYLPAVAGGGSEMVLTLHHAVVDGASSMPLLAELAALCDGSSSTAVLDPSLPPSADALFPARYRGPLLRPSRLAFLLRQFVDEVNYRVRRPRPPRRASEGPAACRILPLTLPETATAALVRRARRERATLTGALNAALLLAVQRHLYGGQAGPLRYFAFADLRPYLSPPQSAATLAAYVAGLRFTMQIPAGAGFWLLARQVSQQIAAAGRRGDKFHAARLMPATMRATLRRRGARMATVALSYAGVVPSAALGDALRVKGLHAFVSNVPQGPEFTASVKLVDGRLVWDIVYLNADMEEDLAERIGGEIVRTLTQEERESSATREGRERA